MKQETLEEVAEIITTTKFSWEQERSYSEEDVLNMLTHFAVEIQRQNKQGIVPLRIKEWFELNKKK
jgi:hypothetical protein